jgi:hypothetical protein
MPTNVLCVIPAKAGIQKHKFSQNRITTNKKSVRPFLRIFVALGMFCVFQNMYASGPRPSPSFAKASEGLAGVTQIKNPEK